MPTSILLDHRIGQILARQMQFAEALVRQTLKPKPNSYNRNAIMKKFDLIVLGAGPSGGTVAKACAEEGKKVALIESREFGGTCALRGCNPKKVFVHAAEVVDAALRSDGKLCDAGSIKIDWPELVKFKQTFVEDIPKNSREKFDDAGIATYLGSPKFISENQLEIDGETIEGEKILLAVGGRPRPLEISGEEHITLSDQFMNLKELPQRVVFIGGGYISLEFAHVASRAGSDVTILERGDRILKKFDATIIEHVEDHAKSIGIDLIKSAKVKSISKDSSGELKVEFEQDGKSQTLDCDLVVHGAGRTPNLDGLDLPAANIAFDEKKGIEIDDALCSVSNPRVFAAGDCAASGKPQLTPTAELEGDAIVESILKGSEKKEPDYGPIAMTVFTVPPIAMVGLTEEAAKEQSLNVRVESEDRSGSGDLKKVCQSHGAYKVLIDKDTDQIVGAHLFGPESSETINAFAIAIAAGMPAKKLKSTLLAFPTFTYRTRSMV